MENERQKKSISEVVLEKIKTGKIKMHPKIYFILKTILIIFGVLIIIPFILFLASFILFSLHINGIWFLPWFGFRGFGMFLNYFPWILILIAIFLIALLEMLTKRFSFVYRRPIVYSLIIVISIVFLASFLINKTTLHPNLFKQARVGRLPLAGPMYRSFGMPEFHDMHRGIISEVMDNGFIIETERGEKLTINVTSDTNFPPEFTAEEGDRVMVIGERNDDIISAFGIRALEDEFDIFDRVSPPPMPPFKP
jgi:hypothetical protein